MAQRICQSVPGLTPMWLWDGDSRGMPVELVDGLVASEALRYVVSVFAVSRFGLPAFSRDVPILLWAALTAAAGWFLGPVLRGWGFGGWEQ